MFEHLYLSLDFQSVWFIRKRDVGDGFQSWHKDLINNAKTAITIVVNVGSYIDPTDTDESDSTESYLYDNNEVNFDKRNELYFQSLYNDKYLDRARTYYRECWTVWDKVGLSLHPLLCIALQLDSLTRLLYNETRGQYEESLFNNRIKESLEIKDEDRRNLPPFLRGEWYALHLVYINDPHFHSENIKKASAIEEHLHIRSRMVGGSPSNSGNIEKDGESDEDDVGDHAGTTNDDDGEVDDDNVASYLPWVME